MVCEERVAQGRSDGYNSARFELWVRAGDIGLVELIEGNTVG